MLRALVLVLVLANAAYFAWANGWLDAVIGVRASGDREPERLARQVRPESVRILPAPASAAAASAVTATATVCLEAGPFDASAVQPARAALAAAATGGTWLDVSVEQPGAWLVYMGKYANRAGLAKKEDELKRRKLDYEEVNAPPELDPGLSLGRFDDRAAADKALADFTQQGVRTARVVELTPPSQRHLLRFETVDAALAAKLAALKGEVFGAGFVACAAGTTGR